MRASYAILLLMMVIFGNEVMSDGPKGLSAAVRVLLEEMEPVANLTAQTAAQVEETCKQLQEDLQTLAAIIAKSTKDASLSALGESRLSFQSMIGDLSRKLQNAGREAAARIGNHLVGNGRDLITAAANFKDKARTYAAVFMGIAMITGIVGGFIGAWLARMA